MRGGRTTIAVIVSAVVVLLSPRTPAQADETKQEALRHFQQAEAYMKVAAYDAAIEEYEAAYALVPKPGFLFNIGLALEKQGKKESALAYYRRYLDKEPEGKASIEARARVLALERDLAHQRDADDRGSKDGASVETTETAVSRTPEAPSGRPGRIKKITGLGLTGAGVVAIALSVKFGLAARDADRRLNELAPPDSWDQPLYEDRNANRRNMYIASAVGAAALLGGGVLYFLGRREARSGEVSVRPSVSDSAVALVLGGSF